MYKRQKLEFNSIEDFDPVNVVNKVDSLKVLFGARERLRDLLTKLDGNDKLDELLKEVLASADKDLEEIKAARSGASAAKADATPEDKKDEADAGEATEPKTE